MTPLMSYLTGFGLASGVGAKAFVPVLLLGGLHYTQYFELSERWVWIASPPVMVVLAALVLVEIVVDSSPELSGHADVVAYLPKAVVGFIAFAAATGDVDQSLLELAGSGLLGSGTAVAGNWLRSRVRQPLRDTVEDLHDGVPRSVSVGEAGVSAVVAGSAVVAPLVGIALLAVVVAGAVLIARAVDGRRTPCVHCGQPIRPRAVVCPHCRREQM
jgi:hypothetical protein